MASSELQTLVFDVSDFIVGKSIQISSMPHFYSLKRAVKGMLGVTPTTEACIEAATPLLPGFDESQMQ
jgi:hypothetical protein